MKSRRARGNKGVANSNNNETSDLNQIKVDFNNIIKFSSGLYLKQKI